MPRQRHEGMMRHEYAEGTAVGFMKEVLHERQLLMGELAAADSQTARGI